MSAEMKMFCGGLSAIAFAAGSFSLVLGPAPQAAAQSIVPAQCTQFDANRMCVQWKAYAGGNAHQAPNGFASWDAATFHSALRSCVAGLAPLVHEAVAEQIQSTATPNPFSRIKTRNAGLCGNLLTMQDLCSNHANSNLGSAVARRCKQWALPIDLDHDYWRLFLDAVQSIDTLNTHAKLIRDASNLHIPKADRYRHQASLAITAVAYLGFGPDCGKVVDEALGSAPNAMAMSIHGALLGMSTAQVEGYQMCRTIEVHNQTERDTYGKRPDLIEVPAICQKHPIQSVEQAVQILGTQLPSFTQSTPVGSVQACYRAMRGSGQ